MAAMALDARVSRRTLVKGAAVGAAGLAATQPFHFRKSSAATEIQFWNPGNDPLGGPIIQKLVDDFNQNEAPKAGFTVKNVPVPTPQGDYTKYTTAMTSSGSPDVVMTYSYNPFIPWVANGFVLPMDKYFQELGLTQDDFYPVALEMVTFQGQVWGLLQEWDMVEFFWNTNIHAGDPPQTIDELDALAPQYVKMDGGNLVQAGLIPWAQGGFSPGGYGSWGTIMNARFYDNDARKWTITAEGNTAFLEWYLKYVDLIGGRDKADALISSVPSTYGDVFLYGKTAFAMEGEFVPLELPAIGQGELANAIKIVHPPTIPGVTKGETTMVDAANVFCIPVKSAHVDEAAYFSKYMVSQQSLVAWATPIGQMMPTKAAANDPGLNAAQPWFKIFNETVESGKLLAPPLSPQAVVFRQAMALAVDNVTYKKQSPAEAIADCEKTVMEAVDQFKSSNPDWQGE
jgi:multiple sugar transport system substrate-binding protein